MSEHPPESRPGRGVAAGYRIPRRTRFPAACVKCGRPDGLSVRRRTFSYVSPTVYIAFTFGCIGMVIGAVFYLATRRSMDLTVPTCSSCETAWERASRRPIIFLAVSLLATLVSSVFVWKLDADRVWLPIVGLLATVLGTMAVHAHGRRATLWANGMDDTAATLVGIHPAVIAVLAAESADRPEGDRPPGG